MVSTMAFGLSAGIVPASFAQTPAQDAPAASSTVEEAVAKAEAMRPDIESFMLDNGLQVVVIPDHRAPVVTQMVWYKIGSADEPPGQSGIAHFLEHLMFKGTKTHPAGEFSKVVSGLGGQGGGQGLGDTLGRTLRIVIGAAVGPFQLEGGLGHARFVAEGDHASEAAVGAGALDQAARLVIQARGANHQTRRGVDLLRQQFQSSFQRRMRKPV